MKKNISSTIKLEWTFLLELFPKYSTPQEEKNIRTFKFQAHHQQTKMDICIKKLIIQLFQIQQ